MKTCPAGPTSIWIVSPYSVDLTNVSYTTATERPQDSESSYSNWGRWFLGLLAWSFGSLSSRSRFWARSEKDNAVRSAGIASSFCRQFGVSGGRWESGLGPEMVMKIKVKGAFDAIEGGQANKKRCPAKEHPWGQENAPLSVPPCMTGRSGARFSAQDGLIVATPTSVMDARRGGQRSHFGQHEAMSQTTTHPICNSFLHSQSPVGPACVHYPMLRSAVNHTPPTRLSCHFPILHAQFVVFLGTVDRNMGRSRIPTTVLSAHSCTDWKLARWNATRSAKPM